MKELNCYTYSESVVAIYLTFIEKNTTYENYKNKINYIRFIKGAGTEYVNILHYASDWMYELVLKKVIQDKSCELGGIRRNKVINYITEHYYQYTELLKRPDWVPVIKKREQLITERKGFYIPKNKLEKMVHLIKDGDLISWTATAKGLDVKHNTIAILDNNGKVYQLEANIYSGKIEITDKDIIEYAKEKEVMDGIIIGRVF